MAIDPSTTRRPIAGDLPPDENVVATYRAISPLAIASFLFGLASIFAFLWPYFAGFGALALVFGVLAVRSIRRIPEALTGERMANAGIGLGLLFSLSALTIGFVQTWVIQREATRFARGYIEALRSGSLEQVVYLQTNPAARKGKSGREVLDEMRQSSKPGMFEMEIQDTRGMLERLSSSPGQTVELGKITDTSSDGVNVYAGFVLIFKGQKTEKFPAETQYGVVRFLGFPEGRTYAWKAISSRFPLPEKPTGY